MCPHLNEIAIGIKTLVNVNIFSSYSRTGHALVNVNIFSSYSGTSHALVNPDVYDKDVTAHTLGIR